MRTRQRSLDGAMPQTAARVRWRRQAYIRFIFRPLASAQRLSRRERAPPRGVDAGFTPSNGFHHWRSFVLRRRRSASALFSATVINPWSTGSRTPG